MDLRLYSNKDTWVTINPQQLTPTARALAECVSASSLHFRTVIWLQSRRTLRELTSPETATIWYTNAELDRPHRIPWSGWAEYRSDSTVDPHEYLEREARKLPIGYYPVGVDPNQPVPSADVARTEPDLLTRSQVLERLATRGINMHPNTWFAYVKRGHAPRPVRHVGRTPQWDAADIDAYAANRPGRGTRTDLNEKAR